jgi:hypothetical protein
MWGVVEVFGSSLLVGTFSAGVQRLCICQAPSFTKSSRTKSHTLFNLLHLLLQPQHELGARYTTAE